MRPEWSGWPSISTHKSGYGELEVECLNRALEEWEGIYNTVRPRQALDLEDPSGIYQ
ncbi:MAG: hypothetical protein ABID84_02670 [Chloroflexota bacterium]